MTVKGDPVLVVQDELPKSVGTDPAVFLPDSEPDVVLQTLLSELVAPVSTNLPFSAPDNLNKPAEPVGPQPVMSERIDPVCPTAHQERPFVKTSQFYGSSKRRCSGVLFPEIPNTIPQSPRTVSKSRKPARLND